MTGIVVLGTGFGCLTHVRAFREAGFDVRAVVGRDPIRTAARADRFDVEGLTSVGEALALDGVDAVSVATPPAVHREHVLAAVAAGKHVLCEKPFASDSAEALSMRDAAVEAGIVHVLGAEFRFDPGQALLARLVQDGAVGVPLDALFTLDAPLVASPDSGVPDWWRDAGRAGGWLGAYGVHVIDQIRATLGELVSVSATLSTPGDRLDTADDGFVALLETADGAGVTLRSTARAHDVFGATRVVGTEATAVLAGETVVVHGPTGPVVHEPSDDLRVLPPSAPPTEGLTTGYEMVHTLGIDFGPYVRLGEVFLALVEGRDPSGWPAPADFDDAVAAQAVLDAIRTSARTGSARVPI